MPRVKDVSRAAAKWAQNAGSAGNAYADGVANPRNDWQQASVAAHENYKAGVARAASQGSFARGVQKAGSQKWQQGAQQKGTARFSQGVAIAQPNYAEGVAPYLQVIQSVALPPRKPKGDPSNINRVAAIATALSAAKRGPAGGAK